MSQQTTTIRLDPKWKKKAAKRAQEMGLSFSDIVRFFVQAFAEGKVSLGFIEEETKYPPEYIAELHKEIEEMERMRKEGMLKEFSTVEDFMADLDNDDS